MWNCRQEVKNNTVLKLTFKFNRLWPGFLIKVFEFVSSVSFFSNVWNKYRQTTVVKSRWYFRHFLRKFVLVGSLTIIGVWIEEEVARKIEATVKSGERKKTGSLLFKNWSRRNGRTQQYLRSSSLHYRLYKGSKKTEESEAESLQQAGIVRVEHNPRLKKEKHSESEN